MAKKKAKRADKPSRERGARWTVRGVPVELQRGAVAAARARGLTLGQWLSALLEEGIARDAPEGSPVTSWAASLEARLARLEARLVAGEPGRARREEEAGDTAAVSGSARADE
ncbi:MAG: hypothetical protein NZ704_11090 [Geminicoccaceae bacterium]|nr:hypothetical protein [Geminicoccaceae bacterium]